MVKRRHLGIKETDIAGLPLVSMVCRRKAAISREYNQKLLSHILGMEGCEMFIG